MKTIIRHKTFLEKFADFIEISLLIIGEKMISKIENFEIVFFILILTILSFAIFS